MQAWLAALVLLSGFFSPSARGTSVVVWGKDAGQTNFPASLTNVVEVSAGALHNLALLDNGTVKSWGNQTNVPSGLSNVVAISTAGEANLALKQDGTLVSWGTNTFGQTNIPGAATNVIAISMGSSHCLALRQDGTVIAWGATNFSQTGVPASATNVVAISAGGAHSVALRKDGEIVCWGRNTFGQVAPVPANATNAATIAAGGEHSLALHTDGSHNYWGVVVNAPPPGYSNAPTGFSNVAALSAGSMHTASLLSDGTVHTDGYPPTVTNQPPGLSNVVGVAAAQGVAVFSSFFPNFSFAAGLHTVALVGDGSIHAPPAPRQHVLQPGAFLILNPMVTGPPPLRYQWNLNGVEVPGAIGARLVIAKANRRDAGDYSVVVSNSSSTITSQVAHVSVSGIIRQRLHSGSVEESGHFVIYSGDEDGTGLIPSDLMRFSLETSPDCLNWTPLAVTPTLTNGLMRFVDVDAALDDKRFYRVRENYPP